MLIVICGPTATGKSGLAIELAQRLDTIILSADSRQVYQEFDIGTAKPAQSERQLIPHYLIDICHPSETLTLADYQSQAQTLINHFLATTGKPVLLVGGTGLYIKSIVQGMKIPRVAPQPEIRSQLANLGQKQCYAILQQVDPEATSKIHFNDSVRTVRALEVFYVTGKPISEQQGEHPPDYPIIQIGLDCDRDLLRERIAQRTKQMLELGWLDEMKILREKYGDNLPLMQTLGYQEMLAYLQGKISLGEAEELTILHTRQFAKRQVTWFRSVTQIQWFDVSLPNLGDRVWSTVQECI